MKIILIGVGTVGVSICIQLASEGHDLTVIDRDPAVLAELSNNSDTFCLVGNGADVSLLRRAGAAHADLLIAVTSQDEVNILCCAAARKLGVRHTVARVRNPEYSDLMELMRGDMNLSLTINPELAAAKDIFRMLRFPSAAKIDTFCHGRLEMAEIPVLPTSPLVGKTLLEIREKLNMTFLVCGVLRDDRAVIPSGDFRLSAGDRIAVAVPDEDITRFFKAIGAYRQPVHDVLIAGGGRITYYLEELLEKAKIRSTIIERDKERCHALAEDYHATVVCGNPTKQTLLLEEGLERTDAFLALSDVDEENAITALYAKTVGVPKSVALISAMNYVDFFKSVGIGSIVSPNSSTATYILRYVRSTAGTKDSEIESLHRIMDERLEAAEFTVKESIEGVTGIPLKSLHKKKDVLIASILRDGIIHIPSGDDSISVGDSVIVIAGLGKVSVLRDILS